MIIKLGKKEPTDIEKALLMAVGLGRVLKGADEIYYIDCPVSGMTQALHIRQNKITLNQRPILHQIYNTQNEHVIAFSLDIDGICQCMDKNWDDETSISIRKKAYEDGVIASHVTLHETILSDLAAFKQLQGKLLYHNNSEQETQCVNEINDIRKLEVKINKFKASHRDIYDKYVKSDASERFIDYIYKGQKKTLTLPSFEFTSPPAKTRDEFRKPETISDFVQRERDNILEDHPFDPTRVPVPRKIQNAIIELINARIKAIESSSSLFMNAPKSHDKANALRDLINIVNQGDYTASDLKTLIKDWHTTGKGVNIDVQRSNFKKYKTEVTKTRQMMDEIDETLNVEGQKDQYTNKPRGQ